MAGNNFQVPPNADGLTVTASKSAYTAGEKIGFEIKNNGARPIFVFRKNFPADLEFEGQVLQKHFEAKEFSPLVLWEDIPNLKMRPAPSVVELGPGKSITGTWNGKAYYEKKEDSLSYFPFGNSLEINIFYETEESFRPNKYYGFSFSAQSNAFEVKHEKSTWVD